MIQNGQLQKNDHNLQKLMHNDYFPKIFIKKINAEFTFFSRVSKIQTCLQLLKDTRFYEIKI